MLKVIEPVSDLFCNALDDRPYWLIKQSVGQNDDIAHELYRMVKTISVQTKDRILPGKDVMSVVAFLRYFRSTCNAWGDMRRHQCGS